MSRIDTFDLRYIGDRLVRRASPGSYRFSLTRRLELLKEGRAHTARLPPSQQFRTRAEECRFEAGIFRDPKARAQMLQLADSYDRKAIQAEEIEMGR